MKFSVRTVLHAAILLCAETVALPQSPRQKPQLEEIASGKTRVIDLSYALSDKLLPWPGDAKAFEAKVNATVEKNGYLTRSLWMLEHYGTHLDAPAHFPPGITAVDKIPVENFFGPAVSSTFEARPSAIGTTQIQIAC
jgi:kynurenine formamidase